MSGNYFSRLRVAKFLQVFQADVSLVGRSEDRHELFLRQRQRERRTRQSHDGTYFSHGCR